MLPRQFGRQEEDKVQRYERVRRLDYRTKDKEKRAGGRSSGSDESESSEEEDSEGLPVSHELELAYHSRPITCISADKSGSRLAVSSIDGIVSLWDFNGMDLNYLVPFKSVETFEREGPQTTANVSIIGTYFSSIQATTLLCVPSSTRAKLYDRDGSFLADYPAGDMYLMDLYNTKGHTAAMTHGVWDPVHANKFATSSIDGTVRIWDAEKVRQIRVDVVKRKGGGSSVTSSNSAGRPSCIGYIGSTGGILVGTDTGELRIYDEKSSRRQAVAFTVGVEDGVNTPDTDSILAVAMTNGSTYSVCSKYSLTLYDGRMLDKPLMKKQRAGNKVGGGQTGEDVESLAGDCSVNSMMFSPDSQHIALASKNLSILDKSDLVSIETVYDEHSENESVTCVGWSSSLNQIFTGHKSGKVKILFSPEISQKGAKSVLDKPPRARHVDELSAMSTSIDIRGLNEAAIKYEEQLAEQNEKRKRERERAKDFEADSEATSLWSTPTPSTEATEDPREALLKYANKKQRKAA